MPMTGRERLNCLMHDKPYDRLPVVHFGFWYETADKWAEEGHIPKSWAREYRAAGQFCDGSAADGEIARALGFDFNYYTTVQQRSGLKSIYPPFSQKVVRYLPDGGRHILNEDGVVVLKKDDAVGIPMEIGHTLVDRESWEKVYRPRLEWTPERIDYEALRQCAARDAARETPLGVYCGSLFGQIRNWMGLLGVTYLYDDDEDLYDEIIDTVGRLQYKVTEALLSAGIQYDFGHFWEDIAGNDGPLVVPSVFREKVAPHYRAICDLLGAHGIDRVSLDCDGRSDALLPVWLDSGVNVAFPIECGSWNGNIADLRKRCGPGLRGVGGMKKSVFAQDPRQVEDEVERLKGLVALGGYLPCPDHRIAPDARWENVLYYTNLMRETFG